MYFVQIFITTHSCKIQVTCGLKTSSKKKSSPGDIAYYPKGHRIPVKGEIRWPVVFSSQKQYTKVPDNQNFHFLKDLRFCIFNVPR